LLELADVVNRGIIGYRTTLDKIGEQPASKHRGLLDGMIAWRLRSPSFDGRKKLKSRSEVAMVALPTSVGTMTMHLSWMNSLEYFITPNSIEPERSPPSRSPTMSIEGKLQDFVACTQSTS
jgi:hypothetical protein